MSALAELLERTEPLADDALAEAVSGHPLRDVLLTLLREIRGAAAPEPEPEPAAGPQPAAPVPAAPPWPAATAA